MYLLLVHHVNNGNYLKISTPFYVLLRFRFVSNVDYGHFTPNALRPSAFSSTYFNSRRPRHAGDDIIIWCQTAINKKLILHRNQDFFVRNVSSLFSNSVDRISNLFLPSSALIGASFPLLVTGIKSPGR